MSADIMPCGCEGHADNEELCQFLALQARFETLQATCAAQREALENVVQAFDTGAIALWREEDISLLNAALSPAVSTDYRDRVWDEALEEAAKHLEADVSGTHFRGECDTHAELKVNRLACELRALKRGGK